MLGGLFASNESKSITEILNKTINDFSTKMATSTEAKVEDNTGTYQEFNVLLDISDMDGCRVEISQDSKVKATTYSNVFAKKSQELQKDLSNKLKTVMEDQIDQKTESLGFGANEAEVYKKSINDTINDLSNRVISNLSSEVKKELDAQQRGVYNIRINRMSCKPDTDQGFYLLQNIDIESAVTKALKDENISKEISKLSNELDTSASTTITQSVAGCCGGLVVLIIIGGIIAAVAKSRSGSFNFFRKGAFKKASNFGSRFKRKFTRKKSKSTSFGKTIKNFFKI